MTDLPEPLTPPNGDLRDFDYMPIFRARLFGSSFHARATDAEWRAGVTLWLKAWDQVPSGSLPDNDIDLCRLAELGRDLKRWTKIREGAMRGWVKCSDGRLYHEVVAEVVLDALGKRTKASRRGKAGATKRWAPNDGASNAPAIAQAMLPLSREHRASNAQAMLGDSKGKERKGSEGTKPNGLAESLSDQDRLWRDGVPYLTKRGVPDGQARGVIGRWLKGNSAAAVLSAIGRAQAEQAVEPISFITACLKPGKQSAPDGGYVPMGPAGG